jgi:hypothetical protein
MQTSKIMINDDTTETHAAPISKKRTAMKKINGTLQSHRQMARLSLSFQRSVVPLFKLESLNCLLQSCKKYRQRGATLHCLLPGKSSGFYGSLRSSPFSVSKRGYKSRQPFTDGRDHDHHQSREADRGKYPEPDQQGNEDNYFHPCSLKLTSSGPGSKKLVAGRCQYLPALKA